MGNNPIFQSAGNGAEDSIDYGELPAGNSMEYQLNPMNDNHSMAFDSAGSEHTGTAAQNQYGKAASFTQTNETTLSKNTPWAIIGDLNITMYNHETSTITSPTTTEFPEIQQIIDVSNLSDLGFVGSKFTWSNRQSGDDLVMAGLDRALVNGLWLQFYANSKLTHINVVGSDHTSIILCTESNSHQGKRPYRYFKCWFKDPTCHEVIKQSYRTNFRGSHAYCFTNRLRNVKYALSKWNLTHFGNIDQKVKDLRNQLQVLSSQSTTSQNIESIKNVEKDLEHWQKVQEDFYAQKSREEYIKCFDRNTSFYHTSINMRKHYNHFSALKLNNGQWTEDRAQLEDLLVSHFSSISSTSNPFQDSSFFNCIDSCITGEDNDKLLSPVTLQEVKDTIKQMNSWSAPGPDGFPPGKLISPYQAAYVPGRNIQDNVVIAHELVHSMKKMPKKKKCDHWCELILQCISTTSISILLNGSPCKTYKPTRSLRQGDPLSPYLFIICMEALSRYLIQAENNQLIHGFKVTKDAPSISHPLFVDDCLVFTKASHQEADNMMSLIKDFGYVSGQVINFQKSGCFFSKNVHPDVCVSLIRSLNVKKIGLDDKYLGIPLLIGRSKNQAFSHLVNNFDRKVPNWKGKNFTQAGRYVMVQNVLRSSPIYHMNTFLLPDNLIHKMDQKQRDFW
ncbi:uncharacterized protein LOC113358999 [Papaver somniferum]|uniref:uncharacterized protein LOC113358999 n=1 Tax=Papaver somniferum TaxID=3469 RepID=UPI000E6FC69C|nr:uncharacterized protein LOC113358999 [Papaver somniferum]